MEHRLSVGLHSIVLTYVDVKSNNNWNQFWVQVVKNNEKLRMYCEEGQYDEAKDIIING